MIRVELDEIYDSALKNQKDTRKIEVDLASSDTELF